MGKIVDLLPKGRENAIPSKMLAKLVGASSVRELQKRISRERAGGAVILSTCEAGGGYFRPASSEEIKVFIDTLEARARNTHGALRSAKTALELSQEKTAPGDSSTQGGRSAI